MHLNDNSLTNSPGGRRTVNLHGSVDGTYIHMYFKIYYSRPNFYFFLIDLTKSDSKNVFFLQPTSSPGQDNQSHQQQFGGEVCFNNYFFNFF